MLAANLNETLEYDMGAFNHAMLTYSVYFEP